MEIGPISNKPAIPQACRKAEEDALSDPRGTLGKDSVEISPDGRQRLAELADAALLSDKQTKLELVRARIAQNYYDRSDVKEQVAGRLIDDLT